MSRSYLAKMFGALAAAILLLAAGASAAVINVPTDYATIQAAINAASPGDEIVIAAGTYQESLGGWRDIELYKSASLIGAGSGQTIVEFSGLQHGLAIRPDATGTVLVEGITFTRRTGNQKSADWAILVGETGGTFQSIAFRDVEVAWAEARNLHFANATYHSIVIEDCDIHHAKAWGCSVRGTINALNLTNSNFHHNGWSNADKGIGFDIDLPTYSANIVVTGGSFSNNTNKGINLVKTVDAVFDGITANSNGGHAEGGFGVSLWEWSSASSGLVFRNSTFAGNASDGFLFGTEGTTTISDVIIENCFINGNARHGVLFFHNYGGSVSDITVQGCDLTGNVGRGIATSAVSTTIDAPGNWWGSNLESGVLTAVGASVDYTPWLDTGTDTSLDPGFQGDFSTLWVSAASPQAGTKGRVQEAVDLVSGSTIHVLPGLYEEQVWITTGGLTLVGAGSGNDPITDTIIRAPAGTMPNSFNTGAVNRPIIGVIGCTGVAIENLRVDGYGRGNANNRFEGIAFWNAGGSIGQCYVVDVRDTPFSGTQHGVGVYAYNNTGGPYTIAMSGVVVEGFQKNALALSGAGLLVDLEGVVATGAGPTAVTAQNGIQISWGAAGTVKGCTISGVDYTGSGTFAAGFLLYAAGGVDAENVAIDNCQMGTYWFNGGGSFVDGSITNPTYDGLWFYNTGAKSAADTKRGQPQPFDAEAVGGSTKAAHSMLVANSIFHGAGDPDSYGVVAWGADGMTFMVTESEVKDWGYGIVVYDGGGAVYDATVEESAIYGNAAYGLYTNAAQTVQASCNWWGDIGGPDAAGNLNPAGDEVLGDVIFWPWLDGIGGACDQYGADNVAVGEASACLTPDVTCVTLPVEFVRADTTASRGVSVTFQLGVELVLCDTPINSIVIATGTGSWSGAYTNLVHQIVDNGGGSYTVDRAILGEPCGPDHGGLLFTVSVAKAAGVIDDAVGTLTVTEVVVRDCDNQPLPGIPGPPGTVVIDLTSPPVLADLVAAQQKTGNPAGSTTNVLLSWTVPGGDAELIHIWRKGYGFYPEYDDAGGAPAAGPVTGANGWQYVGSVAATATGYTDNTTARDFWYYAAYVEDTCGNVSAVSAITGGTLNYHLGDVSDGVTPGMGDNVVGTADISLLGTHYGVNLAHNDPVNFLDVGPTTDYSVNARPVTDNRVQFEDLMMFAINYGVVSKGEMEPPLPAVVNEVVLVSGALGEVGSLLQVEVRLSGDGQIQGLSVPLTWDGAVVEPVGFSAGALLSAQGGLTMVLSPEPGTVDAAVFGVRERGISGEGTLAVVSFKVLSAGDPRLGLGAITARDAANQAVNLHGTISGDVPGSLPTISALQGAMPNPFNPSTELSFAIAREGSVKLSVYSLRGRLITTLVNEQLSAGSYSVTWHGTDGSGQSVASGSYIVRLEAPDRVQSQRIMLVK